MIDLRTDLRSPNARDFGYTSGRSVSLRVEQVKLEFGGHDDLKTHLGEGRGRAFEDVTWIGEEW